MPLTATATPDAVLGTYMVLRATGGTAPYSWTAYPNGGTAYTVPRTVADPTGATTVDGLAPLGREVTYQVRDSAGASFDVTAQLPDAPSAVLSDALNPDRALFVTVLDQLPNEWAARSVWFDVLDRRDPFVALAPMRFRNGTIVVRTVTADERRDLFDMLTPGGPLVLRSPCAAAVDDLTILVNQVSEELTVESAKTGPRSWSLTYQAVSSELGPYLPDPDWDWDGVVSDPRNPSWDVVAASFTSWDDLVTTTRKP
jgi:hypothetical protein